MTRIKNARALYVEKDKIWIARGLKFWAIDFDGKPINKPIKVGSSVYNIRVLRQLLRKGIHHLLPLQNGNFFITLKKKALVVNKKGEMVSTFSGYHGNKPGHRGVCLTPNGFIFFGEYSLNTNRDIEINLYRSVDNGLTFQIIKSFAPGEIRHIHFIEWDNYSKCIWLGTGDYGQNNEECRLYRSFDYGDTFELVGSGGQLWRSIAICPIKEYVYWGTDAGHCKDSNAILRFNKETKSLENIYELTGPCHGMCVTRESRIFISSGVEGGENEKDRFAKLYKVNNSFVEEIKRIKKDVFPFIVQYGVIRFPSGCENSNYLIYTAMGLKHNGENVYIERI